ncbi:GMP synthase (glutamine-hydrolyzing) [Bradyrhizobium sp. GM2.2]|uniref:glutamine-hydrolyzing GMP synthase n=1 Tax=unclassified Bradyrhizobium TaxID=2631580 RepID=UPI001FF9DA92|nr:MULTISPECIES: glutamine-hydrolyzing GMP synthase [unclassified Bradyrhizobium]MCK1273200.1 glutamine-hydrolyzing GMP synthase [Bradyrhizobium sp. 84]MCK1293767.1 glutamine-hydrolyzing GMP synthase [Bradyrhizobium sp. 30]MCK1314242.1 glutamine-hydrolyzing GMP synthase [Bradyrhizobium sp. 23]MCK1376456.1 glutamine-hydrolyzing GMP synthase [Bradyrhizobium sp. 49]MCK1430259.1 glutamine-hydrolyzing GMP synthase [Bradyrhizobium sp. 87]
MTAAQTDRSASTPSVASAHDKILIVDFGSQVTQLIARRVREDGVYCEIVPFNKAEQAFNEMKPKAVILSGGPESVHEAGSPRAPQAIFDSGVPVMGICYGQMAMAEQLGGTVEGGHHREFGRADVEVKAPSKLFEDVWSPGGKNQVWMSHGDRITKMPPGFSVAGTSPNAPFAIIQDETRKYYGLMFHPEVVHTPDGAKLIRNFVRKIAGLSGDWTMRAFREEEIAKIRTQVGKGRVLCGLSGGVDSAVAAVLIHEAIGEQLTCVFVDHGMLRLDEAKTVVDLFRHHYNIPLVHVDASKQFLGELEGVTDPEVKRKTIGRLFIEVFEAEAKKIGGADFLAQGTLYPDVIESVSFTGGPSVTIKSHHNVGGLPERMNMKLVEPLRELFKDEVRKLGRELGLPEIFVGRHPFPGPGLAIRCPGDITREKLDILRKADAVYIDQIRKHGLYDDIWQAFAVLLPVKTVGVMGDGRTYDFVVGLRAVTSTDGMTADFYQFDMKFLGETATRIINEVKGVNRVVYDVTSKPPGTIEWE